MDGHQGGLWYLLSPSECKSGSQFPEIWERCFRRKFGQVPSNVPMAGNAGTYVQYSL